jgi:uncharacterized protein YycO
MNAIDTDKLKPADVILVYHKKFDMSAIPVKLGNFFKSGYDERGWTHVAIYIGDGKVVESLAFGVGVVERNINEAYLKGNHQLRILRHKNSTDEQNRKAAEFCKAEIGDKYEKREQIYFIFNYLVVPSFRFALDNQFIDNLFKNNKSYFCSELVASAFEAAGSYPFERAPRKIMPLDFYNPYIFESVAEAIYPTTENRLVYLIKNSFFYFFYLVAALFFFAIDVCLAVVAVLCSHIMFFAIFIIAAMTAIWKAARKWVNREMGE